MDYFELDFVIHDLQDHKRDLLINMLGEIGFDTFEETEHGFKGYIPRDNFDENLLAGHLTPYRQLFAFAYIKNFIPQKNWNEEWEKNFEPITIADKVYVRATFHDPHPEFPFEIVIDPKMAFGTGHHQTTAMMLQMMLEDDFAGKKVLDMGCGTGILAIMAEKLGAAEVTAIDYDQVCCDSALENSALNHSKNIGVLYGSREAIPDEQFDMVLANINRNILLDQIERYSEVLKPGGKLFLSGFYEALDLEIITLEAAKHGLKYIAHQKDKDWVAAKFTH
jgi:ribosomal protein L11 methyltransferase